MRINISGDDEKLPDDIIIHGSIPKSPVRQCKTCAKLWDCSILQYSMNSAETIGYTSKISDAFSELAYMPFPMPCRGESWQSLPNKSFTSNPLVQRLGLADVSEPGSGIREE